MSNKKPVHKHQTSWSRKKPVRFPTKAALWPVIKLPIRFPQYTCCIWLFLKLCLFLLPAWGKPFSHLSLPYPGTLQPSGLLDPETLVSTIWHLSSYFISICPPPHVHLQHKHKSPRLTGHCWQTKLISFRFPAHDHWWEPEFHGSLGNSDRGNHVDAVWSWNQSVVPAAFEVWSTTGAYTSKLTEICNKGDDLQVRHAAGRNMLLRIHRGRWHHFNINMFIVQTETHETLHKRHL